MNLNPFETPQQTQSCKLVHKRSLRLNSSSGTSLANHSIVTPRRLTTRFELDQNTEDTRIRTERAMLESMYLRQLLVKKRLETKVRVQREQGTTLIRRLYNCCHKLRAGMEQLEMQVQERHQFRVLIKKLDQIKQFLDEQRLESIETSWNKFEPIARNRLNMLAIQCCVGIHKLPEILDALEGQQLNDELKEDAEAIDELSDHHQDEDSWSQVFTSEMLTKDAKRLEGKKKSEVVTQAASTSKSLTIERPDQMAYDLLHSLCENLDKLKIGVYNGVQLLEESVQHMTETIRLIPDF